MVELVSFMERSQKYPNAGKWLKGKSTFPPCRFTADIHGFLWFLP